MTAILLIDDHAIVRSGIRKLLAGLPEIDLKEVATGEAALLDRPRLPYEFADGRGTFAWFCRAQFAH